MSSNSNSPENLRQALKRLKKRRRRYGGPMGFLRLYIRHLRQYMTTGLLVWVPFFVTAWVCWVVISRVGFGINAFMERVVNQVTQMGEKISFLSFLSGTTYYPWMGIGLAIALFLTTGFLARYLLTRKVIGAGEFILKKIPLISRVYVAVQQIRDVYVSRDGAVFHKVVILQYPRKGLWVVGFVTSQEHGIIQAAVDSELTAVFVPTTPNPTSGFLLYASPEELTPLNITVEDAMKLIISGGAFMPSAAPGRHREEEEEDLYEDEA